jgi:hypothetical protein
LAATMSALRLQHRVLLKIGEWSRRFFRQAASYGAAPVADHVVGLAASEATGPGGEGYRGRTFSQCGGVHLALVGSARRG